MMRFFNFLAFALLLFVGGCALSNTSYSPNPNPTVTSGGGGKVKVYKGVQFWAGGSPERSYEVVGQINDQRPAEPDAIENLRNRVVDIVKQHDADGVILVKSQVQSVTSPVTTTYYVGDPFLYGSPFGPPFDPDFGLSYYPSGDFFYPSESVTSDVTRHDLYSTFKVFKYAK